MTTMKNNVVARRKPVSEIFKAQKFLKKYLKLGQLDLAENIFAMLKTLCRNYRIEFVGANIKQEYLSNIFHSKRYSTRVESENFPKKNLERLTT